MVPPIEAMPQVSMDVPLTAWKAYGYWARPVIEGIEVRNNASELHKCSDIKRILKEPKPQLQITSYKV